MTCSLCGPGLLEANPRFRRRSASLGGKSEFGARTGSTSIPYTPGRERAAVTIFEGIEFISSELHDETNEARYRKLDALLNLLLRLEEEQEDRELFEDEEEEEATYA